MYEQEKLSKAITSFFWNVGIYWVPALILLGVLIAGKVMQ